MKILMEINGRQIDVITTERTAINCVAFVAQFCFTQPDTDSEKAPQISIEDTAD